MARLPLLLSVPHAGSEVPQVIASLCILSHAQLLRDGDEGASEIYWPLEPQVAAFLTTKLARAIIDLNRREDDFSKDGVIKTHTCWDESVYSQPPSPEQCRQLLDQYYRPYHRRLQELATSGVYAGIDCHTMAAVAPPVAPDPGQTRPMICLSDVDGSSCPRVWMEDLAECFREAFQAEVRINDPFKGGFITRTHARELPWIQLELSRAPEPDNATKSRQVLAALTQWCKRRGWKPI